MTKIDLTFIRKSNKDLQELMARHYSQPKGFVGRQTIYKISVGGTFYGCIAFGSTTKHLPGRQIIGSLNNGMNNVFYHVEPVNGKYPIRNFTSKVLIEAEKIAVEDWKLFYKDDVFWIESLVELPRTGELYKKAGYIETGITEGFTCKREGGRGSDSWSGKRVWDTENLRPKRVFVKYL